MVKKREFRSFEEEVKLLREENVKLRRQLRRAREKNRMYAKLIPKLGNIREKVAVTPQTQ